MSVRIKPRLGRKRVPRPLPGARLRRTGCRRIDPGSAPLTSVLADEDYLTRSMMEPRSQIVSGFAPLMPVYQGVLPQPEAAAIVEFIKSLRFASREPPVLPSLSAYPLCLVPNRGSSVHSCIEMPGGFAI